MQATHSTPPSLATIISTDMHEVDLIIANRLDSGVPLVGQVSRYIIAAGGKRLRPALLLLICGALGFKGAQRFNLAAVVEFIHTATLLHDDVVDDSALRRGNATANETFGNPASVLVGDFLYSRAFQMMVDAQNMRIMEVLADATNIIAEGEVMQLMNMHNAALDEAGYLQVIRSKTAKLFEASARVGAILAGADATTEAACADYGQALGTAFQVMVTCPLPGATVIPPTGAGAELPLPPHAQTHKTTNKAAIFRRSEVKDMGFWFSIGASPIMQ